MWENGKNNNKNRGKNGVHVYLQKTHTILTVIHYITFITSVNRYSDWGEKKPHDGHQNKRKNNKTLTNNTVICSDTDMKSIPAG